jgi:chromosome segregation ATPase
MRAEIEQARVAHHRFGTALADLSGKLEEIESLPGRLAQLDAEYEGKKKRLAEIDALIAQKEAQLSDLTVRYNDALAMMRGAMGKAA